MGGNTIEKEDLHIPPYVMLVLGGSSALFT